MIGRDQNYIEKQVGKIMEERGKYACGKPRKREERLAPCDIMRRARLTPAEVRAILDRDRRKCA